MRHWITDAKLPAKLDNPRELGISDKSSPLPPVLGARRGHITVPSRPDKFGPILEMRLYPVDRRGLDVRPWVFWLVIGAAVLALVLALLLK